jgi:thiamine biosynthesis lipoprotein
MAAAITLIRPAAPTIAGWTTKALGTFASVLVTPPDALNEAQEILSAELAAIDLACSRFRPDSELSALNSAGGRTIPVSPLFALALEVALWAAEATDGDVDPTCGLSLVGIGYDRDYAEVVAREGSLAGQPTPAAGWWCVDLDAAGLTARVPAGVLLDLGATAKALAADLAATAIADRLGCGVLVNLGGDIAVAGPAPEGGWKVGIDDGVTGAADSGPGVDHAGNGGRQGVAPVVSIEAGGLATSSPGVRSWRRGDLALHHIVVPGTGRPAEICWAAVSVAAATCVDANTASTAAVIRGRSAPAWLADLGLAARLARPDGSVLTTGGWPS